jgi:hypothetical protein
MEKQIKKKTVGQKGEIWELDLPEASMASIEEFSDRGTAVASCSSEPGRTTRRKNSAADSSSKSRFSNLENGVVPYVYSSNTSGLSSDVHLRDAVVLCQKAYYNVPIFRNTIDLMTEFSLSDIYFTGGNEQSRKFFSLWLDKVDIWSLQEQFYRELYRSGNVFFYSFRGEIGRDNMMKLANVFDLDYKLVENGGKIPIKYILLNPADISLLSSSSFVSVDYYKNLNDYELGALIDPKSEEDKRIADSIPELKQYSKGKSAGRLTGGVKIKLDRERLTSCFYKKQGYEPLSVPMGFAVLEDINAKLELKKIDRAISRTMQQAVLLITMGDKEIGLPSPKSIAAMRSLFDNQSVGKVLVADYTTQAKFIIPEIGNLLDPKKYEIIDSDIRTGLNNILFGEEKFSNTSIKVKVFFARLEYGRQKFLREFLIPEMNRVGKMLGFKKIPTPKLNDVHLEDNIIMSRVYTQLGSIGVLTPEEVLEAFETGRLPTPEESVQSQENFKKMRDKGYYLPITVNTQPKEADSNRDGQNQGNQFAEKTGRPPGTGGEEQVNVRQPRVTASIQEPEEKYSVLKMKEVLSSLSKLEKIIETRVKENYSIKRLNKSQKELIGEFSEIISRKEGMENWENQELVYSYVDDIAKASSETSKSEEEIDRLASVHGLSLQAATILYYSKIEEEKQ